MGSSSADDTNTMLNQQLQDSQAQERTARQTAYATEENALKSAGTGVYLGVSQNKVNPDNNTVEPTVNQGGNDNV